MYKVTAWWKGKKISQKFYDVHDAIEFRDDVDAHYPTKIIFRKVISMREFIYNSWTLVMDHEKNPLSSIPDFSTRHMIMQVLAWMWCIVFGIMVGSMYMGVFSMALHTLLIGAVAITVGTFETAKRRPQFFGGFGRGKGGEHE
jgi:tetrahydromethanopterin S-methyltransferase subunit B